MKFVSSQKDLIEALSIVSSVTTERKSQFPVLSNTLITTCDCGKDSVRFVSTDSIICASVVIRSNVLVEGSVCMSAKDLLDRVRKMPTDSDITIDDEGNIFCDNSPRKHRIPVMNAELFPSVQIPAISDSRINIAASKIRELVNKTWFVVSGDHSQPSINNSYLVFNGTKVQMVSFDGYRLAFTEQDHELDNCTISIPQKAISFIKKWLTKADNIVSIVSNAHGIYFSIENVIYGFRIIDVTPPDYNRIFSIEYDNIVMVNKDDLIDSLLSNMLTDDRVVFSFDLKNNKCRLSCQDSEGKFTKDEISCKIKGEPVSFKLNGKFLLESVNAFTTEKVRFRLGKSKSDPVMITETGFKTVIAPMVD